MRMNVNILVAACGTALLFGAGCDFSSGGARAELERVTKEGGAQVKVRACERDRDTKLYRCTITGSDAELEKFATSIGYKRFELDPAKLKRNECPADTKNVYFTLSGAAKVKDSRFKYHEVCVSVAQDPAKSSAVFVLGARG